MCSAALSECGAPHDSRPGFGNLDSRNTFYCHRTRFQFAHDLECYAEQGSLSKFKE